MREKRVYIEGAFYHVTSRTNNKIKAFESGIRQKIMLITIKAAKSKFGFTLTNFCIMPTHIHLLIQPKERSNLSSIMQWIKTQSAKWWNRNNNSEDHLWGKRFFSRAIMSQQDFDYIMNYIDQNPVVAGIVTEPAEWKASGAYYKALGISGLIS